MKPTVIDNGLKQFLKDQLFNPIYLGHKDNAIGMLDLQTEGWKHYHQIPLIKEVVPIFRRKAEEEVVQLRTQFFILRKQFLDKANLVVNGLDRSIRSGGRKKYRRPRSL